MSALSVYSAFDILVYELWKKYLEKIVLVGGLFMKIIVVYGGKSAEHDISILTAFSIIKEIYFD